MQRPTDWPANRPAARPAARPATQLADQPAGRLAESPHWLRLLGRTVRDTRIRAGMTQTELGHPVLTKGFISQFEQGTSAVSIESLFHIANRLGTSPARLLSASDPEQVVLTTLDMVEAALVLHGPDSAHRWLMRLSTLLFNEGVEVPVLLELIVHDNHTISRRVLRYRALTALHDGNNAIAIHLLSQLLQAVNETTVGEPHGNSGPVRRHAYDPTWTPVVDDDEQVAMLWLGQAHRHAGHHRAAIRCWEQLLESGPAPMLRVAALQRLAALYDDLGDNFEAELIRRRMWTDPSMNPDDPVCGWAHRAPDPESHRHAATPTTPTSKHTPGQNHRRCPDPDVPASVQTHWLWMMARDAYESKDFLTTSAYARPIPLLVPGTGVNSPREADTVSSR